MPITNPEAVKFCNDRVRLMADVLGVAYNSAKAIVLEWNANSMASLIPNTTDLVVDGSERDGRHQITGAEATNIITRAMELIADYEATNNAKLNTVAAVGICGWTPFRG